MYETVGFYNHFGNGDIFESREFVRTIMVLLPASEYVYYNGKSPRLLMDIPNLRVDNNVTANLLPTSPVIVEGNSVYINTWIGRDSRYVLPGIGCTVEMLYKMYNDILRTFSDVQLPGTPIDYLTDFDYTQFDIKRISNFAKMGPPGIFISNGNVQSSQASNFDMTDLILRLAWRLPTTTIFITQSLPCTLPKYVVDANSLVSPELDSNLVELSYLSTFCNLIVGRNSGPHVFAWTKKNCMSDKMNLTLTYNINSRHFVYDISKINMRVRHSMETATGSLCAEIEAFLIEYYESRRNKETK